MDSEKGEIISGKVSLTAFGEPIELELDIPNEPVTIRRMLPVFNQITDQFAEIGVQSAASKGRKASCKNRCSACCRQMVPISSSEAYALSALLDAMPKSRKSKVKERFSSAIETLSKKGWVARLDEYETLNPEEQTNVYQEYFLEGIPCPLLEDDSCSIYEDRPAICREYLVTSDPDKCTDPFDGSIIRVGLLLGIGDVIRDLGKFPMFIPLILALEFAERTKEDKSMKTGAEWIDRFFVAVNRRANSSKHLV